MNPIEKELKQHQQTFDLYESTIEEDFSIEHEKFRDVDARQLRLERNWNRLYGRVTALHQRAKYESEKAFSEAFVSASSNKRRIVNSTEAKQYATCDPNYADAKTIENKVYLLYKDLEAVCETLETRKYVLKDLVALTVIDAQNTLI